MSNLGTALSTPEGRSTFTTFAEESVRERMRRRWERRRTETETPPALFDYRGMVDPSTAEESRYFSADLRTYWPCSDDGYPRGYVPFSLRIMTVCP